MAAEILAKQKTLDIHDNNASWFNGGYALTKVGRNG
jgi:uncharacterized protein YqfB (UPF0267 family)